MRVAIVGNGNVGSALGSNIAEAGHEVVYGVRGPKIGTESGGGIPLRSVAEAAAHADVIILAVHWPAVDDALKACGNIDGRILVDCTNPYDFQNALAALVPADQSAASLIAEKTTAKVVKAFNQVGAAVMADARTRQVRPLQFVASDHDDARALVLQLARDIGFDARDGGGIEYARELEGMARLWIAQAFAHGMEPTTAWAFSAG